MEEHRELGWDLGGARAMRDGARTVAWLSGQHDVATADRLKEFLVDAGAQGADLVVDLSGVSFMDASTIAAIVHARSRMAENSLRLTVRSPSAFMERVLGICGLDELIDGAEVAHVEGHTRPRSALETWVPVKARKPSSSDTTRPAPDEAREASRE